MESGTPGLKATRDGWMNRALALGQSLPRSLRGRNAAIAMNSLGEFQVRDAEASSMFERCIPRRPRGLKVSGARQHAS